MEKNFEHYELSNFCLFGYHSVNNSSYWLGKGESLEDILGSMNQVAEGVATAGAVMKLARRYKVSLPVLTAVARILEDDLDPRDAVEEIMNLPQVPEV